MAGLIIFLLLIVPVILYRGLVISWLWEWFITPLGVQSIGVMHAAGISLIVSALTFQMTKSVIDDQFKDSTPAVRLVVTFILGLILNSLWFGIGYIISFFV